MIQVNTSAPHRGGSQAFVRNVGFRHNCPSQSAWCNAVVLVMKKKWKFMLLYRLLMSQCPQEEGLISTT